MNINTINDVDMKNRSLLFGLLLVCALSIWADEPVFIEKIFDYSGENNLTETTPESPTPFIDKLKFTSAEAGDYMWFNVYDTKLNFNIWLGGYDKNTYPGCYLLNNVTRLKKDDDWRIYLTDDMLAKINSGDLRVYGKGKLTEVNLYQDNIKRNQISNRRSQGKKTIWTGYYWMDAWTTLELYPVAFNGINLSDFESIRFYHEANRVDYTIKVAVNLSSDIIADNDAITHYSTYAELMLTDAIRTRLSSLESRLLVQMHKNGGDAFNFTDIVLVPPTPCDNCFLVTF